MLNYPFSRYLNVRTAYFPTFSPDGRRLAFLSNITGQAQAWQVDLSHGYLPLPWPDQLTFASDRVMSLSYAPVDDQLLYSHDVGGSENAQLFLLRPSTGEERCLTENFAAAMHIPGDWSPDGRSFLFAANRRHPGLFDLYEQAVGSPEARLIWQNDTPGFLFRHQYSPDGETAVTIRMRSSFASDLLAVNRQTGTVRQLNPPEQQAKYSAFAFAPDGRSLYVLTDLEADFTYIARLDLAALTWTPVVQPQWDVEMLSLSPDGRFLAYTINEGGQSHLELLDMAQKTVRLPLVEDEAPGVIGWFDNTLAFSADSRQLAFSYTSAVRTSDVYVWHLDRETAVPVTRSSHGGIPQDTFVKPKLMHYPTFDQRHIPAWYYLPEKDREEKLPVVILVHGGPESQFRPYFNFLAQYLAHQGFAVLGPNVRGSTGYGKNYSHLDDVEKRMDSVADLAQAAVWLQKQAEIDASRIVVYGGSYGGFMVLAALTHYPNLWAAGVDIVGISNLATFLKNTSDYRRAHREAEYGSLAEDREFLEEIAPINHLDKITAPLMVIHGANDPRVPLSEAEQLVAALQKRGVPVEFLVFADEGHGIAKLKNKLEAYPAVVAFLRQVLAE